MTLTVDDGIVLGAKWQIAMRTDIFDPTSVPGLAGWWAADNLPLVDGDAVASWADLSPSFQGPLVQATGAKQPTFKSLAKGRCVRFDGGDGLRLASYAGLNTRQQFDIFAVLQNTGSGTVIAELSDNYNSVQTGFIIDQFSAGGRFEVGHREVAGYTSFQTTSAYTSVTLLEATWDGTLATNEASININGAAAAGARATNTNTAIALATNNLNIGARANGGSAFWTGDLYELLIFSSVLSASDRELMNAYLNGKYGIY